MLTTPGSALLISVETSVLSGDDGATDALLNPPVDVDDVDELGAEDTVVFPVFACKCTPDGAACNGQNGNSGERPVASSRSDTLGFARWGIGVENGWRACGSRP